MIQYSLLAIYHKNQTLGLKSENTKSCLPCNFELFWLIVLLLQYLYYRLQTLHKKDWTQISCSIKDSPHYFHEQMTFSYYITIHPPETFNIWILFYFEVYVITVVLTSIHITNKKYILILPKTVQRIFLLFFFLIQRTQILLCCFLPRNLTFEVNSSSSRRTGRCSLRDDCLLRKFYFLSIRTSNALSRTLDLFPFVCYISICTSL